MGQLAPRVRRSLSGLTGLVVHPQASGALDFETQATHYLVIEVSGATGEVRSERLTVTLTDVNEAPTGLTLDDSVFAVGAETVGTLTVDDEDAGTLVTDYEYEITGTDASRFRIDEDNGEVIYSGSTFNTKGVGSTYDITITHRQRLRLIAPIRLVRISPSPKAVFISSALVRRIALKTASIVVPRFCEKVMMAVAQISRLVNSMIPRAERLVLLSLVRRPLIFR